MSAAKDQVAGAVSAGSGDDAADAELRRLGYSPELKRVMGFFSSFAASFSGISITNSLFLTLPVILANSGAGGIWTWIPSSIGAILVALIFADLVGRIPVAGYAYQWSSRLTTPRVGWFVAWAGIMAFGVGCASVVYGTAPFFLSEFGIEVTFSSQIWCAVIFTVIVAAINLVGLRLAAIINNFAVAAELVGGGLIGVGLLVTAIVAHPHPVSDLFHQQPGASGGYFGAWILAFLLGAYSYAAWELPADLAEETHDAPNVAAKAMLWSVGITAVAGMLLLISYTYASPDIGQTLNEDVPILSIIQYQWGGTLTDICNIFFLVSFVSLAILIMAGAARLLYSLGRDNMILGSSLLKRVSKEKVPGWAIVATALFVIAMFVIPAEISSSVSAYTLGTASVGYNAVYLMMVIIYIVQAHRGKLPEQFGGISLGRWALPIAYVAAVWQLFLIGTLTLPNINQKVGLTSLIFFAVAGIWYLVYVHRATGRGEAGPPPTPSLDDAAADAKAAAVPAGGAE